MLRREYHAKDSDMAEKDKFVQERINSLKEWKANAMTQINFLFQKLRIAVPISELQVANKQLEIEKQRTNDFTMRVARMAKEKSELEKKVRQNDEADEKMRILFDEKEQLEEEFEIIKTRLENLDQTFKWENSIYKKVANILKRAQVSPVQAFQEFDENGDGVLTKAEFHTAIFEKLRIYDVTTAEFEILWESLDADHSGTIDYKEFVRKLEQYGVKNLSKEEFILLQMVKAC